jgi:pimeloyl-ACP methyl ester carboxylesterase
VTTSLNTPIQPQFRPIDGLSIRFAESEHRDEHALLLSPWPESLFAFEPTWSPLAEDMHLVAVDLPGFGHSQRRDDLLSPRAMGEFVVHLADTFGLDQRTSAQARCSSLRRHILIASEASSSAPAHPRIHSSSVNR